MYPHAIHPDVAAAIEAWKRPHPLAKLRSALVGHDQPGPFLDALAEAAVARYLLGRGHDLSFEVPTPAGRACDFEVRTGDERLYVHVKRLDSVPAQRKLTISSRLRTLERIERPYLVGVRWQDDATDEEMQRLVESASGFLQYARVGDELVVHADDGTEIGGLLVVAPWDGTHVSLMIGLPSGFIDEAPRLRKLMRRAYKQFMPRETNVILLASSRTDDADDVATALLGALVERWDALPPRGRRIAYGRAADGFWYDRRYAESQAVGWFRVDPTNDDITLRMWYRDGITDHERAFIERVIGGEA